LGKKGQTKKEKATQAKKKREEPKVGQAGNKESNLQLYKGSGKGGDGSVKNKSAGRGS